MSSPSHIELNLALASALGLTVEGLMRFTIDIDARRMPHLDATYLVRNVDGVGEVLRRFELSPRGPAKVDVSTLTDGPAYVEVARDVD